MIRENCWREKERNERRILSAQRGGCWIAITIVYRLFRARIVGCPVQRGVLEFFLSPNGSPVHRTYWGENKRKLVVATWWRRSLSNKMGCRKYKLAFRDLAFLVREGSARFFFSPNKIYIAAGNLLILFFLSSLWNCFIPLFVISSYFSFHDIFQPIEQTWAHGPFESIR